MEIIPMPDPHPHEAMKDDLGTMVTQTKPVELTDRLVAEGLNNDHTRRANFMLLKELQGSASNREMSADFPKLLPRQDITIRVRALVAAEPLPRMN
jgi:hypothetical protein